jgi:hypothetical protein
MDAQQVARLLAGVGLPTGEQVAHLQAWPLVPVMFMLEMRLELVRMFGNGWHRFGHGLPSKPGSSPRL